MKKQKGDIILGIRDKAYEGNWEVDKVNKLVTFVFATPLPDGTLKVGLRYDRYSPLIAYQLGGQIVNDQLDEKNA